MLEARSIGRQRPDGEGWLFRHIELTLHSGERVALVGPTGAGKSLVLRALALLDPLDEGEICFRGHQVAAHAVPRFRSQVLYLHQRPVLFEGTVEANLRRPFALKANRAKVFDQRRAHDLLGALGREPSFLAKPHHVLSGGESQLVAMVRAMLLDPVVLLLDEPTSALDARTARAVEELLAGWVQEAAPTGRNHGHDPQGGPAGARRTHGCSAFVWVTHDRAQGGRVAQRTLVMHDGAIHEAGAC